MQTRILTGLSRALAMLVVGYAGFATTIVYPPGPITIDGSWTSGGFYEDGWTPGGPTTFDRITMVSVNGPVFEVSPQPSGVVNFSDAGWSATTSPGGTVVIASGPAYGSGIGNLYYNFHFDGDPGTPIEFLYSIWQGANLLTIQDISWNGSTWSYPYLTGDSYRAAAETVTTAVPDGGLTVVLLGMSTLGLGWFRRMVK